MPTYQEAEKELLKKYHDCQTLVKLKTADALPMDVVIHACKHNAYPASYLKQFINAHFSEAEKRFYDLTQKGLIIRSDDSKSPSPTTPFNYSNRLGEICILRD